MIKTKETIRKILPNITEDVCLQRQKRTDIRIIKRVESLTESDYPKHISEVYLEKTGHKLNLENPQRLTEKIQWRKLYDRNPVYSKLSDKYLVREWVDAKIGKEHLVPLLGVWDHFDDIDFTMLPDQFVLKTNNASHTNVIVKDKEVFLRKRKSIERKMEYWLKTPFAYLEGLELQYQTIRPRIIAEKYLPPEKGKTDLTDYKFHCFCGVPYLCQVIGNRSGKEVIDFYDEKWEHVNLKRPPYLNAMEASQKPSNYENMIYLAMQLSKGFQYVRVDMYEYDNMVFFGEMTFTPASGMMRFEPDDWDYRLGGLWNIHSKQVEIEEVEIISAD